jgi:hypothetical protein
MYSLALLIVELRSARRRLLKAFEVSNGTNGQAFAAPYSQQVESESALTHIKSALRFLRYDSDNSQAMEIGQPRTANLAEALKMKLLICFRHLKCICRKWYRGMDYSWHVQHLLREFGCGPLADLRSVSEWKETSREATSSRHVGSAGVQFAESPGRSVRGLGGGVPVGLAALSHFPKQPPAVVAKRRWMRAKGGERGPGSERGGSAAYFRAKRVV